MSSGSRGHKGRRSSQTDLVGAGKEGCAHTGPGEVTERRTTPLIRPPVALTIDVFARILAEVGRADDEDLEALWPGLVASPHAGRDAHGVPFFGSTISSSTFIRPLPLKTTYTSSCFMFVWPYGKR